MAFDMKLVEKGRKVPRKGLLDQARHHMVLERKYRGALQAAGWTAQHGAQLRDCYDLLESQMAATVEARSDSRENRVVEQGWIDEAKAFKRKLVRAFIILHHDGIVRDDDRKVIEQSGSLRRSTPAILEYLALIHDKVARYDRELSPFFGGASALAILERTKSGLAETQGIQEAALTALPQETLRVYEAKGRLLSLIERMNHIARIAFDGQAHIIAEFNKDLILRARKRRSQSTVETVEQNPEGNQEETG